MHAAERRLRESKDCPEQPDHCSCAKIGCAVAHGEQRWLAADQCTRVARARLSNPAVQRLRGRYMTSYPLHSLRVAQNSDSRLARRSADCKMSNCQIEMCHLSVSLQTFYNDTILGALHDSNAQHGILPSVGGAIPITTKKECQLVSIASSVRSPGSTATSFSVNCFSRATAASTRTIFNTSV